jgi:HK97 gp10 family phage protein
MPGWSCKIIADTATPKLTAFAGRLANEVEMGLDPVGADMVDLARSIVPVDTGALRESIYHRPAGLELEFGAAMDYASYVEFGTSRMRAQPYMRPSLDAFQQRLLDAIRVGCLNALGV